MILQPMHAHNITIPTVAVAVVGSFKQSFHSLCDSILRHGSIFCLFLLFFFKYEKYVFLWLRCMMPKPKIAAKQHDFVRLCHVNPAQSKEVSAYNTNQCQHILSYLFDWLSPLNYTMLIYLSAAKL